ncbi:MAG: hypothetical protein ABJA82_07585 [Myxococcales bacterium]
MRTRKAIRSPIIVRLALGVMVGLMLMSPYSAGEVVAFVRSNDQVGRPLIWRSPVFALSLGTALPGGVARSVMLRALRAAAESWNSVDCASVEIDVKDLPDAALTVGSDQVNSVVPHLMALVHGRTRSRLSRPPERRAHHNAVWSRAPACWYGRRWSAVVVATALSP